MTPEAKVALEAVDRRFLELQESATSGTVRAKLGNLNDTCRHLVVVGGQRLTVPEVVRAYAARFTARDQSLAESSIRNRRGGANPYLELYRAWEGTAESVLVPVRARRSVAATGEILTNDDLAGIQDVALRHRVRLLVVQNRSLRNEVNILKEVRGAPIVQMTAVYPVDSVQERTPAMTLTEADVDAVRDFVDPRKLRSRHLKRADDGAIETMDGRTLADPGLCDALEKIVRHYAH
jgi:hypothetical protein